MNRLPITRRDLLKTGAIAASLAASSSAVAHGVEKSPGDLTIGVATTQFSDFTNAQLARELAGQGIRTIQLFLTQSDSSYWKYNGRSDLSDLTAERSREIADTYRSSGISIHSLGVYTNLIHPDPAERQANLDYFEAMMQVGAHMNVHAFVTEAGYYYDPAKPAPPVEYHFQEKVWKQMRQTAKKLAALAEKYQATVMFESFHRHFFASAKRTRVFLEEVGSPSLRALLDPANLLEVNDLTEMFTQLKPWIDCLHAKDRKLHVDRGVPAGQGDLDYPQFVTLAARHTPDAPLILEYVGGKDYRQALDHLRGVIRKLS